MAHINTFRELQSQWLDRLKKSGCRELFIGIESGNDDTLQHINKPFTSDVAFQTVTKILDAQISVKCYFILGFPGESENALTDTLELAYRLYNYAEKRGVRLRISPFRFRPYHGTALYNELLDKGINISPISNRIDILDSSDFNSFDCVSDNYAEYDENTLDKSMKELEKLTS